jgi:hypothetical protein
VKIQATAFFIRLRYNIRKLYEIRRAPVVPVDGLCAPEPIAVPALQARRILLRGVPRSGQDPTPRIVQKTG